MWLDWISLWQQFSKCIPKSPGAPKDPIRALQAHHKEPPSSLCLVCSSVPHAYPIHTSYFTSWSGSLPIFSIGLCVVPLSACNGILGLPERLYMHWQISLRLLFRSAKGSKIFVRTLFCGMSMELNIVQLTSIVCSLVTIVRMKWLI